MQFECRMAGCSTQQVRRRRMLGCGDVVWCEAARDVHEPQSGELHEWKWLKQAHISLVYKMVPQHHNIGGSYDTRTSQMSIIEEAAARP